MHGQNLSKDGLNREIRENSICLGNAAMENKGLELQFAKCNLQQL
jgi:hypothetical protein